MQSCACAFCLGQKNVSCRLQLTIPARTRAVSQEGHMEAAECETLPSRFETRGMRARESNSRMRAPPVPLVPLQRAFIRIATADCPVLSQIALQILR